MSQFLKIRDKTKLCSHIYDTKTMIKLLLLIDELKEKGYSLTYFLFDDVKKYGEEVVYSREDHKKQVEEFSKLSNDLDVFIKEKEHEIKNLIGNLSCQINKEGESS